MKNLLLLFFLAIGAIAHSQVSITTDGSLPDNSAMLDVKSTNKGILVPRMTQAQRDAIASPATGLMIYQTDNSPGFYFNSGTSASPVWVIAGTGYGWGLTGNSGTSAGTNFIGTIDGQPLRFRVNNLWAGEIHPSTLNTFLGFLAGQTNTTGYQNTGIGAYALYNNSNASRNTAVGTNALFTQSYNNGDNSWLSDNVAVGYNALYLNSPTSTSNGIQNTAVGNYALQGNTTGTLNTASGYASLVSNTIGSYNTAYGTSTLRNNISGNDNMATGENALYSNNTGNQNLAVGSNALYFNTSGSFNTAIGNDALYYLNGGSDNLAIGADAGTSSGSPGVTNTISIGNYGYLNASSNQAFIGNLSTLWNGGNKTWSTFSDARMKNNVKDDVKGLDFILRLHPVTYYRSIDAAMKITGNKGTRDFPGKNDVEKIKETGFLAQEVERAAKEAGYDFSGVTVPKKTNELYTLSYELFVVPLVKAVQELNQKNEELKVKSEKLTAENEEQKLTNEELKLQIVQLIQRIEKLEAK